MLFLLAIPIIALFFSGKDFKTVAWNKTSVLINLVKLGWVPQITVEEMCAEMVEEDLKFAKRSQLLKENGYDISISTDT